MKKAFGHNYFQSQSSYVLLLGWVNLHELSLIDRQTDTVHQADLCITLIIVATPNEGDVLCVCVSFVSLFSFILFNRHTWTLHTDDSVTTGGEQPCHDAETTNCPSDQTSDQTLPSICCLCWSRRPFWLSSVEGVETCEWEGVAKRLTTEQVKLYIGLYERGL